MATFTKITPTMLVRSAERGHIPTVGGVTLPTRLGSTDTAAAFVLLDVTLPPYWDACVLHRHAHTTEIMYVLNGNENATSAASAPCHPPAIPACAQRFQPRSMCGSLILIEMTMGTRSEIMGVIGAAAPRHAPATR